MTDLNHLDPETRERVQALRMAYQIVFGTGEQRSREQQLVWADLTAFCRLHRPAFEPGQPDVTAMRLGRQEVILRINESLRVNSEPTVAELLSPLFPDRSHTGDATE